MRVRIRHILFIMTSIYYFNWPLEFRYSYNHHNNALNKNQLKIIIISENPSHPEVRQDYRSSEHSLKIYLQRYKVPKYFLTRMCPSLAAMVVIPIIACWGWEWEEIWWGFNVWFITFSDRHPVTIELKILFIFRLL